MKAIFFALCCCCLLPIGLHAQHYFNLDIQTDTTNLLAKATLPVADGYLVVGDFTSFDSYSAFFMKKYDVTGQLLWTRILAEGEGLEIASINSGESFRPTKDGHFILLTILAKEPRPTELDIGLMKVTSEGEVLWHRRYGTEFHEVAFDVVVAEDGGYLIVGAKQDPNEHILSDVYVIKADAMGGVEWDQVYGTQNFSKGVSGKQTADGGFIIGGLLYATPSNLSNTYVVKINSLGEVEWEKEFGSKINDGASDVHVLSDGNYLVYGGRGVLVGEEYIKCRSYVKLDTMGNIIWNKIYHIPRLISNRSSIIEKPDGGFIHTSIYRNKHFMVQPLLINLTAEADTIWTKTVTIDSLNYVYLYDIEATPDGGYIMAGFNHTHRPQYGWLVKTDTLGNTCSDLGCDSSAVVAGLPFASSLLTPSILQLFPNPAQQQVTIAWKQPLASNAQLIIYDATGKQLQRITIGKNQHTHLLETHQWLDGLYICHLVIDGQIQDTEKLMILR